MRYLLKGGMATKLAGFIHQLQIDKDSEFIWWPSKFNCPAAFDDIFLPNPKVQNILTDDYTVLVGPPARSFEQPADPQEISNILNENCVFKPIITGLANQYPTDKNVLGIHIRRAGIKTTQADEVKYMTLVDEKLDEGFEKVFIASDKQDVKQFYIKRYGNRSLYIPHNYFNRDTVNAAYIAAGDMLCLSRCGYILRSGRLYFGYISSLFQMTPNQKGLILV